MQQIVIMMGHRSSMVYHGFGWMYVGPLMKSVHPK